MFGRRYADLDEPTGSVGAVLESADFHPNRTGRNHLRVLALSSGVDGHRIAEVLELVDLSAVADRKVAGYSLGMRQRFGLATALLGKRELSSSMSR